MHEYKNVQRLGVGAFIHWTPLGTKDDKMRPIYIYSAAPLRRTSVQLTPQHQFIIHNAREPSLPPKQFIEHSHFRDLITLFTDIHKSIKVIT